MSLFLTQSEIAKKIDKDAGYVSRLANKWIAARELERVDGKIDFVKFEELRNKKRDPRKKPYNERLKAKADREKVDPKKESTKQRQHRGSLEDALTETAWIKRDKEQVSLDKAIERVVQVDGVRSNATGVGNRCLKNLEGIANRVSPIYAAETDQHVIFNHLLNEIREACRELAGDPIPLQRK